ncbi:gamma-glutamyltransferase [Jannaschia aquimarina]|uniref:Glutathione hydrolase proenzyme n=1 Tax=Jannaschia aquimarina TaxID=935700 RepID=A0A0D1EHL9_9RHOB|nr:gamma-glutamyltransferase [Jannaschia aquimarina]KIT16346.1 Gamma-glutamyltranspeptidase precursor [Jannaschia aquimarina]SNT25840.1 gamma-glutamyltransferase 1 Threonine peptidase. MEROPS family T03 [Jannaschia aquimarina]
MRYLALLAMLATPAFAQEASDAVAPESGNGLVGEGAAPVESQDWMVAAANPLAAEAGARVLREGGSAADAMVAVQAVLGLVEPQSSGLGGGAFLVWYNAATGEVTTLDGRETAPMAATPTLFQTEDGETMGFFDAVVGGLSVGTPGTPMLMEEAHRRWGRANWGGLFAEAITLAEDGFAVSPRLAGAVANDQERLSTQPATAAYFLPDGAPLAEGATLTNPAYADTLRAMAANGAEVLYEGEIAEGIIAAVRGASQPGLLTLDDLAAYAVIERPAVCAPYRGAEVCGMGPPSSGALTVGQILMMLEPYDMAALGPDAPEAWRLIGDASRLAFADRGLYMADSDFVPMPDLLDAEYMAGRAELLAGDDALPEVSAGTPPWDHAGLMPDFAPGFSPSMPSTSHISIVDADGNALSMTTTIENGFGSRVFAPGGFLLNNELTDFSFSTHSDNRPVANRVEPGKRPRSSMSPTIVMQDGAPVFVVGSPGGSRIIGYVAKTIVAHLDWGLDPQAAIELPHLVNRFGTYDLEEGTAAEGLGEALTGLGFEVNVRGLNSGLHAIAVTPDGLVGGADPRREGVAIGE